MLGMRSSSVLALAFVVFSTFACSKAPDADSTRSNALAVVPAAEAPVAPPSSPAAQPVVTPAETPAAVAVAPAAAEAAAVPAAPAVAPRAKKRVARIQPPAAPAEAAPPVVEAAAATDTQPAEMSATKKKRFAALTSDADLHPYDSAPAAPRAPVSSTP